MALNPPMSSPGMPMGIVGESFCLHRPGVGIEFSRGGVRVRAPGALFLTTVRLCLVLDRPQGDVTALDVPIQGILGDPEFKQPIFGANRLEGRVAPVPGRGLDGGGGAGVPWSVTFNNGGAGTLLRVFFTLIERHRTADHAARQAFLSAPRISAYLHSLLGLQDPNDPSVLYVSQPPAAAGGATWAGYTAPPHPPQAGGPPGVGAGYAQPAGAPPVNPAYLAAMGGGAQPGPPTGTVGYGTPVGPYPGQPTAPQGGGYPHER